MLHIQWLRGIMAYTRLLRKDPELAPRMIICPRKWYNIGTYDEVLEISVWLSAWFLLAPATE